MLTSWVLFPLVLGALCLGWGWALAMVMRVRVPAVLAPGLGMAGLVVVGQFLTLADATAELTTPLVAAVAVLGLVLGPLRSLRPPPAWALAAAAGVFAVYAAPIVLSGDATFAGYIKLDDTATWLAFTDHLMEHGRDLDGLTPSTFEATLAFNIGDGYPVGVFVPLGAATQIVGEDVAWLVQPYMAFWAALLALGLYALARSAVTGPRARAVAAFAGAQPALLFGYYLWGGIKEVAAIALIATATALVVRAARRGAVRAVLPVAVVAGALVGVLSLGGFVWLGPVLLIGLIFCAASLGRRAAVVRAGVFAGVVALASLPVIVVGGFLPPTSSPLTAAGALGNLGDPLEPAQIAGLWPAGDFRSVPEPSLAAYAAVVFVSAAAAAGLLVARARRAWWTLAFAGCTLFAALAIWLAGSPWVQGKALATASVAIPFAAMIGAFAAWGSGRRALGAAVLALVLGGVLWSNALAYRDVSLGPRDRLAELEAIGQEIEDEGPTLMTEYEPYGARHFLREGEAEGVSELRRRSIPTDDGDPVPKGESADTDELDSDDLLVYRSLVLRRSPVRSRPPSPYQVTWSGRYYELWQRPERIRSVQRLALGGAFDPGAVPACSEVAALGRRAGPGGRLLAAPAANPVVVGFTAGEGERTEIPREGEYEAWLLGSVRGEARLFADGEEVGAARHELNHEGGYVPLGTAELPAGEVELRVELGEADLHPGSGGPQAGLGVVVLARASGPADPISVPVEDAERLCGHRWDWIELR